jgi:hypothetical protein
MKVTLDLDDLRAQAAEIEARMAELDVERQLAYGRLNDLRGLITLMERLYGQTSAEGNATAEPIVVESESQASTPPLNSEPMLDLMLTDTKEAISRVLRESGTPWKVKDLTGEMLRRGWKPRSDTDNAFSAVNTAINRLHKSNPDVVRPRYGYYAWRPQPPAAHGASMSSGSFGHRAGDSP